MKAALLIAAIIVGLLVFTIYESIARYGECRHLGFSAFYCIMELRRH